MIVLGTGVLWSTHNSQIRYYLELNQQLNAPVSMYIAQNVSVVEGILLDTEKIAELSDIVSQLNPGIEVYALDAAGKVMLAANQQKSVLREQVDMTPINAFINRSKPFPLFAENPGTESGNSIFSVHPLYPENKLVPNTKNETEPVGYIYVVLASEQQRSLSDSLFYNKSSQDLFVTIAAILVLTGVCATALFFVLTLRLKKLRYRVTQRLQHIEDEGESDGDAHQSQFTKSPDELEDLANAYDVLADSLTRSNQRIRQADQSRRDLFASISHDLRTPLTTLQTYLETLKTHDDRFTEAERHHYLTIALNHTNRLKRLVSDIFELSRLDNGDMEPNCESFSLLELAHDIVQDYQPTNQCDSVYLDVVAETASASNWQVTADIDMTTRVFTNLLGNALKHTDLNDKISITLRHDQPERVGIVFSDTGEGMSTSTQQQIVGGDTWKNWKRNYQQPGGLGLQIVQLILRLHGSALSVHSQLGMGTRFEFELPATDSRD